MCVLRYDFFFSKDHKIICTIAARLFLFYTSKEKLSSMLPYLLKHLDDKINIGHTIKLSKNTNNADCLVLHLGL